MIVGGRDLRWIDDHCHARLAVPPLGAVEPQGFCAVDGYSEDFTLWDLVSCEKLLHDLSLDILLCHWRQA